MNTAREQFEHDYLLAVMNHESTWNYVVAESENLETDELAVQLADEFYEMVMDVTSLIPEGAQMVLRELLLGQGTDTWYGIAKRVKEQAK